MDGYDRTRVGWREGETHGNRSDLCKGIRRSTVYGVTLFVLRIAATLSCRDFEIIPATSSRVCCGDDVATFHIVTRALVLVGKQVDINYPDTPCFQVGQVSLRFKIDFA